MNYKIDLKFSARKITAGLAIIIGIVPFIIKSNNKSVINEWRAQYNIDDQHIITQDLRNGMASFICYLLVDTASENIEVQAYIDDFTPTTPTEQHFHEELQRILTSYDSYPNDFKLALIKLFKNCYIFSLSAGVFDKRTWHYALKQYYRVVYAMLDDQHQAFSYGPAQGKMLPQA